MKVYFGRRSAGVFTVLVGDDYGHWGSLPLRRDLRLFTTEGGFAWGSYVDGAAQLALAILADAMGDDVLAMRNFLAFRDEWVAQLDPAMGWEIDEEQIRAWLAEQDAGGEDDELKGRST